MTENVIIIVRVCAGVSAAIYSARANLKLFLVDGLQTDASANRLPLDSEKKFWGKGISAFDDERWLLKKI